jgi:hypothetical protein
MLIDPEMKWRGGPFPYSALQAAGITPASTHREVMDSSFSLMETDSFDEDARNAWDSLRLLERRLWVDLLLLEGSPSELASQLQGFGSAAEPIETVEMTPPFEALDTMERDFEPFQTREQPLSMPVSVRLALYSAPEVRFDVKENPCPPKE